VSAQEGDPKTKANDYAYETLKQLLTLASAILAVTITFLKDALGDERESAICTLLVPIAWGCLIASIWTAWIAMADATRSIGTGASGGYAFGSGRPRQLARIAQWSFLMGIASLGVFALSNFRLFFR
jgi:hypothetical protein